MFRHIATDIGLTQFPYTLMAIRVSVQYCSDVWSKVLIAANETEVLVAVGRSGPLPSRRGLRFARREMCGICENGLAGELAEGYAFPSLTAASL